jgi:uncharacterized membrane protein YfcA
MDAVPIWLPFAFLAIALAYSAAGFGGGTAYVAVLAVSGLPYLAIPQIALVCNIIVTCGGVWHFRRGGHMDFKRILPFLILSFPLAFVGGRMHIGQSQFYVLLGLVLIAAGVAMMIGKRAEAERQPISVARAWWVGLPAGGVLGLLAGSVGIGGGVFLAPVLVLTGWLPAKQTAAAASLFILVNSAAALAGQFAKAVHIDIMVVPLAVAALVGGQIGSRAGSYRLPAVGVRRVLAAIILVVGLRIFWKAI